MKRTLLISLLFWSHSIFAQFSDDFSDGDFSSNVAWSGETNLFDVNPSFELQLNAPAVSDVAYLSTSSQAIENAQWEFLVRLDFNASGSNYADIFLVSNQANLEANLEGYFVRVGDTQDEISLYRQDGGIESVIIDGIDDFIDFTTVQTRVRVTRGADGLWSLEADSAGGSDYTFLGTVQDQTYTTTSFFGIKCVYTQTRSDKFFFDDFIVTGSPFVDEDPPSLEEIIVVNNQFLRLKFNEAIDPLSITNLLNYSVNDGIENPISASQNESDEIDLNFTTSFINGQSYELTLNGITDLSGNVIAQTTQEFFFFIPAVPEVSDVIINEIFADPSPSVGLPEVEYLEIYNRSNQAFDLQEWVFVNTTTAKELPARPLLPGQYIILCDEENIALMEVFGDVIGLPSFTALANAQDSLTLISNTGLVLDAVAYTDQWYGSTAFSEGGYALERINPQAQCSQMNNWTASTNATGGSPGQENSVFDNTPDSTAPLVENYFFESPQSLVIVFSEPMDMLSLEFGSYTMSNGIDIISVTQIGNQIDRIGLELSQVLDPSVTYQLNIENVFDCEGNDIGQGSIEILIGFEPQFGDVIITEIMADPTPVVGLPGFEYVELYNTTDHLINLRECSLDEAIISNGTFIFPNEYLILAKAEAALSFFAFDNFATAEPWSDTFLNNTGEELEFRNADGDLVNQITYNLSAHTVQKREGGWSLEMKNLEEACRGMDNWGSSTNFQGGTPGALNSINTEEADLTPPRLTDIWVQDNQSIVLLFDENLDSDALNSININIDNNAMALAPAFLDNQLDRVSVSILPSMQSGWVYNLTIEGLKDCVGNESIEPQSERFALPEEAQVGDIILNEVLFNPPENGTDFVELYNNSEKVVSLRDWRLTNVDNGIPVNLSVLTEEGKLIFPGDFLVLTSDARAIESTFPAGKAAAYFEMTSFPSYNNDEGTVVLMMPDAQISDEFSYQADYHFSLLDNVKGVSLERIDFDRVTNDPSNWHSASTLAGNATPGLPNSQFFQGSIPESSISVEPELFSPDNDGFEDFLNIHYLFDEAGYLGSVNIFDSRGHPIRALVNNGLMATSGTIKWDGTTDEQTKARIGVYVIFIEVFDLEGNLSVFKKTCVVGNRF